MLKYLRQKSANPFFIFAVSWLVLQTHPTFAQSHQDWSYNLGIYEVNVRQYTEEGTFAAFEAHLDRLREMGVGILWFIPIHPIGVQNRLGTLGSYYSVRDYFDVNPEFGTVNDFASLVEKIHERGMRVIIDWVANHTSWDNVLTTRHPEWYSKDGNGRFIAPPGTDWTDVIDLDYSQQSLRDYMIDAMKFWALDVGVDGFRCDAASMVPKDFWVQAIAELKAVKPDLFMLAEADGREWHDAGFDMTYGWGLYGLGNGVLKRIADGTNNAAHLSSYLTGEKNLYPAGAYRMYFTSNHDENSWQGTPTELFGDAADAFTVLTATCNGMPLIYDGQEAGLDKRLLFFDKDEIVWQDLEKADLFTKLLRLKRENRALWNGEKGGLWQRVPTTDNAGIFAFVREKEGDKVLVALNLTDRERTVTLQGTSFFGSYRNVLTGDTAAFTASAVLTMPAWGYAVYDSRGADTGMMEEAVPDGFDLGQNFPNPFNSTTRITYSLGALSEPRLTIYDLLGREVQNLAMGPKHAGVYDITLNATTMPSGEYVYQLQAGNRKETKRLLLLR